MKVLHRNGKVVATATDAYDGPEEFIDAPEDFDINKMSDYMVVDGVLSIPAPTSITMKQARLALLQTDLLETVEAGMSSMSKADQITWEFSQTVVRNDPLVLHMAEALSLDDAALDSLFALGVTL